MKERTKQISLSYRMFYRASCKRGFFGCTRTPFNFLEYTIDIVPLFVLWRLRYKLSKSNLAEMFLERGLAITHEAVLEWEACFDPLLSDHQRAMRRGQTGRSWYVDDTSVVNVNGKWCSLSNHRSDGNLVASHLCEKRDMETAKHFFEQTVEVDGHTTSE